MNKDIIILRELASKYAQIASDPINEKNAILHRAVNDIKQIRPVVLINEIPWNEFNEIEELKILCSDPLYREVETFFRHEIYRWNHFRGDMIIRPYYAVTKTVHSTGIGITKVEETIGSESGGICSHKYTNQLETDEDIEKIHNPIITYDENDTKARFNKIAEAIGDIIPVKICGHEMDYGIACKTWDDVAEFMGVENLLFTLADRPEFMHKIASKLTDAYISMVRQYEDLNLFEPNQIYVHATSALTSTLSKDVDYNHVKAKNIWGRGIAQIFASVSKYMRDEFDIQYMKKALEPFGLVYYGCCEPLHNMIDILEQIPNLRKISITPWADVDVAADTIGSRYVMGCKPNPAFVIDTNSSEDAIRQELTRILNASKRNNCSCDIVLKDISTVQGNPDNISKWEKIAMDLVLNY